MEKRVSNVKKDSEETTVVPAAKIGRLLDFASKGDAESVRQILDEGLPVNVKDYDGRTAMHLAASEGHFNVIQLLLDRNAEVNPIDRKQDTPLANAKRHQLDPERQQRWQDYARVIELLESHKGEVKSQIDIPQDHQPDYEIGHDELGWENQKTIGMGSYGEVILVNWRGTNVAAKMIQQKLAKKQEIEKEFRMELSVLQRLRHPNIVQFLGAVTKANRLVIVTEYLPNVTPFSA